MGDHSLWVDEAGTASLVETFLQGWTPEYPSGIDSGRSKPFLIITALSVSYFGLNDFALRLPSALIGILVVYIVFKWSKEVFDYKVGFLASLIISFSSWHVAMSQNARMYMMFQFLYLTTFFFLYKYIQSEKNRYILLILIFMCLTVLTHITGYILFLTVPLLILMSSKISIKKNIVTLMPVLIIAAVVADLFFFDLSHILGRFVFHPYSAVDHIFWWLSNLPVIVFAGILGMKKIYEENNELFNCFILGIIPPTLTYFLLVDLAASRYLFFVLPFMTIAASLYIVRFAEGFESSKQIYVILIAVLAIIITSGSPLSHELGSYSPQPDYKSAYESIEGNFTPNDTLVVGRSMPADHYLRIPDYVLIEEDFVEKPILNGTEYYSGAPTISNKSEFETVIREHNSGWVISTISVQKGLNDELLAKIEELELFLSEEGIKVWRWR